MTELQKLILNTTIEQGSAYKASKELNRNSSQITAVLRLLKKRGIIKIETKNIGDRVVNNYKEIEIL